MEIFIAVVEVCLFDGILCERAYSLVIVKINCVFLYDFIVPDITLFTGQIEAHFFNYQAFSVKDTVCSVFFSLSD